MENNDIPDKYLKNNQGFEKTLKKNKRTKAVRTKTKLQNDWHKSKSADKKARGRTKLQKS